MRVSTQLVTVPSASKWMRTVEPVVLILVDADSTMIDDPSGFSSAAIGIRLFVVSRLSRILFRFVLVAFRLVIGVAQ